MTVSERGDSVKGTGLCILFIEINHGVNKLIHSRAISLQRENVKLMAEFISIIDKDKESRKIGHVVCRNIVDFLSPFFRPWC